MISEKKNVAIAQVVVVRDQETGCGDRCKKDADAIDVPFVAAQIEEQDWQQDDHVRFGEDRDSKPHTREERRGIALGEAVDCDEQAQADEGF